jgi:hypothetical protein
MIAAPRTCGTALALLAIRGSHMAKQLPSPVKNEEERREERREFLKLLSGGIALAGAVGCTTDGSPTGRIEP